MNIVILDDYQDAVRKLACAEKLEPYPAKVFTNTVKGVGQLSVRLRDADILVLIRERTQVSRQLIEKLPKLKLIAQTGRVGSHIDVAACTERGVAVAEGVGSPTATAELTWALIMASARRLPQYIANLKHGAWQQSGLKSQSMPVNFGLGSMLKGKTLGIWSYGKIGALVAGYGKAFGMNVIVWGSDDAQRRVDAAGDALEHGETRHAQREVGCRACQRGGRVAAGSPAPPRRRGRRPRDGAGSARTGPPAGGRPGPASASSPAPRRRPGPGACSRPCARCA